MFYFNFVWTAKALKTKQNWNLDHLKADCTINKF